MEDWFKTKFINPRDKEGNPQTARLEYAREFFKALGEKDARLSGVSILGSTMKGYGNQETSDIDMIVYYYEEGEDVVIPSHKMLGVETPPVTQKVDTFKKNLALFREEFKLKKTKEGKRNFAFDNDPGPINLRERFGAFIDGQEMTFEDLLNNADIFDRLSYPTIETPNKNGLLPIGKVIEILKKSIAKINPDQREMLVRTILEHAKVFIQEEFKKYSKRKDPNVEKTDYVEYRLKMLKKRLETKFGL